MKYQTFSAQLRLERLPYYFQSILAIIKELDKNHFLGLIRDFLSNKKTKIIYLKKHNLVFKLNSYLDLLTLKEVVLDEEYENYGVKVKNQDRIIVDIGAGFGDFSLLQAKKRPQVKIFTFEPDPFYFGLLKDNIKLNKVKNIVPYQKAVNSLRQIFSSHLIL